MASVLTRDVDTQALPPALPARIVDMLRRCLQRDASRRLRDIGDAKLEIEDADVQSVAIVPDAVNPKRRRTGLTLVVAAAALLGALIGFGLNAGTSNDTPSWTGTRLGGPRVAMGPRISPDGKTLAFQAFVDGLTQIAVMNPESGDWKVRTEDRTRGAVGNLSWSPDSTRIYYDRFSGSNRAIFSVPALGGEERLIKENAFAPYPLPDGSLLVHQVNERRETQIYRYWPQENREVPLPALIKTPFNSTFRVFPNGKRAVFWGSTPEQSSTDSGTNLYLLDIEEQTSVRMSVDLQPTSKLAVTPDNKSVVVAVQNGDLGRVVSIPVDPEGTPQTLMNLQHQTETLGMNLDVGPDGSIYVDQSSRPAEVLRFGVSGEDLRRVAIIPNPVIVEPPLHLPDGRTLLSVVMAGHRRLVIATPGKDHTPFVEGDEETGTPATLLGKDRVAFMIGKGKERRIAIASLDNRRILRRLQNVQADGISAMTASPEGKTIYSVEAGTVWSIRVEDGTRSRIHAGDGVAVAPDGKTLTIQLAQVGKAEWVRVDVESGSAQPIAVKEAVIFPLATPPGPNAVGPDGRILMAISVPDFWFFPPAIFDPKTGNIQRVPIRYDADMFTPGWTPDGKIIAVGHTFESTIWRFRPVK
jgi:hypothetical protein